MSFAPKLATLPQAQKTLWPELRPAASEFVLYGGTALALRLGHRQSEDFDFFGNAPVNPDQLLRSLPFLAGAVERQKAPNTLTVEVQRGAPIKLSFFGLTLRRVAEPEMTEDGTLRVASLLDIAACKMAVVAARAESKDYLDIHALLQHGVTLAQALGAAQAVYRGQFNPMITLKALSYFNDGDLAAVPLAVRRDLSAAASAVADLTQFEPLPGGIVPPEIE
jgi:hypothetical protein